MNFLFTPQVILAALCGAALDLDTYFIGMTLISQPIIAGGIAGLLFHNLQTGILIGSLVQLIWISPPVGAYVPPSSPAIAFTATVMALMLPIYEVKNNHQALLMYSIAIGAATGYFVGQADIWNRKLNTRIVHFFEPGILAGRRECILAAQFFSILAKFLRDFGGYIIFFAIGVDLAAKIYNSLPDEVLEGLARALWLMPAIGLAVIYESFRSRLGSILHIVTFIICYILLAANKNMNPWFLTLAVVTACAAVVHNFVWNKKGV
jgi:mannose/fructose/N-acetylgalactosamine-specific phosphotransferase system component IIC